MYAFVKENGKLKQFISLFIIQYHTMSQNKTQEKKQKSLSKIDFRISVKEGYWPTLKKISLDFNDVHR